MDLLLLNENSITHTAPLFAIVHSFIVIPAKFID